MSKAVETKNVNNCVYTEKGAVQEERNRYDIELEEQQKSSMEKDSIWIWIERL